MPAVNVTLTSSIRLHLDHATRKASAAAGYDALLKDGVYWPASVLSEVLNLTVVDVLSMGPAQPLLGQPWSTPNPVAYLPQLGSGLTPNMVSFWQSHADLAATCTADSCLNKPTSPLVINTISQWTRANAIACHSRAESYLTHELCSNKAKRLNLVLSRTCDAHVMQQLCPLLQQHFLMHPSPELTPGQSGLILGFSLS